MKLKGIRYSLVVISLFAVLGAVTLCSPNAPPNTTGAVTSVLDAAQPDAEAAVPRNLEECFLRLKAQLPSDQLELFKERSEEEATTAAHMSLGLWIRNNWIRNDDERLRDYLRRMGLSHPDDMSAVILTSFWRHLHGQPLRLKKQIASYKEYWRRAQRRASIEESRGVAAKRLIEDLMLGLEEVPRKPVEARLQDRGGMAGLRTRYAARFEEGVLVGARKRARAAGHFVIRPHFFDLTRRQLRPVHVPGIEQPESLVVVKDRAYVSGKTGDRTLIVERAAGKLRRLPEPPGRGWLILGVSPPTGGLLGVRANGVFEWRGRQWTRISSGSSGFPRTLVPPISYWQVLYFRDEGRHESRRRLSWFALPQAEERVYFDEHIGLVGPRGPRWENVHAFAFSSNSALWLAAGSALIRWDDKDGYRIALVNGATEFDGDLLGAENAANLAERTPVTGIEPHEDSSLTLVGPYGLYRLRGQRLETRVRFTNTVQQVPTERGKYHYRMLPSSIVTLAPDQYLLGCTFDGVYLLETTATNATLTALDEQLGPPLRW